MTTASFKSVHWLLFIHSLPNQPKPTWLWCVLQVWIFRNTPKAAEECSSGSKYYVDNKFN